MRRALVGFVVAMATLVAAPSAHAQIIIPLPALPPLPPLPDITGILGLPSISGNGQPLSNAESQDRRFAITVASDPVEDQNFPIVLGIARPNTAQAPPVQRMIVTAKPRVAGAACAASRNADSTGAVILDVPTPGDFVRNILQGILLREPGDYLLCGYLQNAEDDAQAVLTVANQITVRSPRGTLAIGAPAAIAAGQPFGITASGTEEVERSAVVTLRPVAAGPPTCGPTAASERALGGDVLSGTIASSTTPTTLSGTVPGQAVAGPALLCGYVGEGVDDPAPEVTTSRTITVVGPTACQVGQASLAQLTASAQAALAAATQRSMQVDAAKARLAVAKRKLTRTKGKRARRTQSARVRGAQALVTEQTKLLGAAQTASTASQSSVATQRAATAGLCR